MNNVWPIVEHVDTSAVHCVEPQHSYEVVEARVVDREAVVASLEIVEGHLGIRASF